MTVSTSSHLRLHRAPESESPTAENSFREDFGESHLDPSEKFWGDFESATGWRLAKASKQGDGELILMPAVDSSSELVVDDAESFEEDFLGSLTNVAATSKSMAKKLASSASVLIESLKDAKHAIRGQAAELGARASLIARPDARATLADRLEAILADAAIACGCTSAGLYLLDDDTTELAIRAVHGLPVTKLADQPRSLQGSRGDLEAMVRGVVMIDDLDAGTIDTWNAPEQAGAAICSLVNSEDVPIGTLWLFADEATEFTGAHEAAARMAARAIGAELSTITESAQRPSLKVSSPPVREIARWQLDSLPAASQLAPDWRADGMIESVEDFATSWHHWDLLPDGTIAIAIAEAIESSITGAMHAAVSHSAFSAHANYRHSPSDMLSRIGDTLWQTNCGDQLVSLIYAHLDPESGEGTLASAGNLTAMIGNRYGYRPVVMGSSEPICTHIDVRCIQESFRMMPGETLLAYSRGMASKPDSQAMLGGCLRQAMSESCNSPLASIRRAMANTPIIEERSAITLLRQ